MTSPLVMMEGVYTRPVALRAMRNWVNKFKAVVPEPINPPRAPHGSQGAGPFIIGLKREMEAAEKVGLEDPEKEKRPKHPAMWSEKKPRGSVGQLLEAALRREALNAKEAERRRGRRRDRSRSRGRKR